MLKYLLILFGVSLLLSSCGYYKFVYFMSVGYGLAIAGNAVAILIMGGVNGWLSSYTVIPVLLCLLFVAYGFRLSFFLIKRELKSATFRKTEVAKGSLAKNKDKKMPIFVLFTIWVFVSFLYVLQTSPMFFRLYNGAKDVALPVVGMIISLLGLLLEAEADREKSKEKKKRPDMVATGGLYKIVRCPNYLGEIIFWIGVFVGGITAYKGVLEWVFAVLALVAIVFIMFNGAQRLEKRQNKTYGGKKEYREYTEKTPIIIPFIPLYHLTKE